MRVVTAGCRRTRLARLCAATATATLLLAACLVNVPATAQDLGLSSSQAQNGKQMYLEADTLTFNQDTDTVVAAGNVRMDYGGNRLVARQVTFDRKTQRLTASGDVELVDAKGNHVFAQHADVTNDFGNGFINALRVETAQKTYLVADNAEREGGITTIFKRGVYTACAPCEKHPDKPPIWRIKSRKIVWNGKAKTIRFLNTRFELFGLPLAYFPSLEVPDPSVKRKSGFLIPEFAYSTHLGFGATIPYFLALAPTFDLTLRPTYFTRQGFLGLAQWRQKFDAGQYDITIAGARMRDPDAFDPNTVDRLLDKNAFRGLVGTHGRFTINPRWTFGWDAMAETDKDFAVSYGLAPYNSYYYTSQVYLTGIKDRNFFDLRAYHFNVQENYPDIYSGNSLYNGLYNDKQPWVLPSLDYSYTPNEPVAGGELNFTLNAASLYRNHIDVSSCLSSQVIGTGACPAVSLGDPNLYGLTNYPIVRGIDGSDTRLTGEVKWRRSLVTEGGLVITPMLSARADGIFDNMSDQSAQAIRDMASDLGVASDIRSAYFRYMATAGLELRWPILFSSTSGSQIIEPVAQIFARPNAPYQTTLGIPNEDAQSLVFDAATLFDEDKFSGFDRIEGGTRANVGVRYSGIFNNGWTAQGIFGESFQLAGRNPFAEPDLVNVGAYSGLQTSASDYVGLVGFASPKGFHVSAGGRFDHDSFAMRRLETTVGYSSAPLSANVQYAFIQAQPLYGFPDDRREVTVSGSTKFAKYWTAGAAGTYDFVSQRLVADSATIAYLDECFGLGLTFSQSRDTNTGEVTNNVGLRVSFRTIGDFGSNTNKFAQQ